jgi:Ca2+-binding RTX toxin-like protein
LSARFDLDELFGLGGPDILTSTNWNDTYLDGGWGNDRLTSVYDMSILHEDVDAGGDVDAEVVLTQVGGVGDDTLSAVLTGGNDLWTESRLNLAAGSGDDDVFITLGGAALFYGARVSVWGGLGDDRILSVESTVPFDSDIVQTIRGGVGNDLIESRTSGNAPHVTNRLFGDAGHDRIYAEAIGFENDGVTEATALNVVSGAAGNDVIEAIALGGQEYASVGTNIVSGDAGSDTIRAEAAHANTLSGGTGSDSIRATLTENYASYSWTPRNDLDGGDGDDFLWASGLSEVWDWWEWSDEEPPLLLTNRLEGGDGNDTMWASGTFLSHIPGSPGGSVRNEMLGGTGNDTIYAEVAEGSLGANRMYGHGGHDRIESRGGEGNLLHGGWGQDRLIGGTGGDTFIGVAGADTFVFGSGPGGADLVRDFATEDRVALVGLVDRGAAGLYDDFVAAVDTVSQAQPGGRVEVAFDAGATVAFVPVGIADPIDSVTDFIRAGQVVSADALV